jgi:multimeric flavodoxin WrbA
MVIITPSTNLNIYFHTFQKNLGIFKEVEMKKVVVINGSPRLDRGNTAFVLAPFLESLEDQGVEIQLLYTSQLRVKPCSCGHLYCWSRSPGVCIHQDAMVDVFPLLKAADILVLATPVYIPLPGDFQNFINRLCPLLQPEIEFREGRTRAQFREDVQIKNIVLLAATGWWEKENADTVIRIAEELAKVADIRFGGAMVRPHAYELRREGRSSEAQQAVMEALQAAAVELLAQGSINPTTLDAISRPLITKEEFFKNRNG